MGVYAHKMAKERLAIHGGTPIRRGDWKWNSSIGEEERRAVDQVMVSGRLSVFRGGPKVKEFQDSFARYSGAKYGVATTSGTSALHTAISALDLKEGDEVILPPITFVSTASVVLQERAKPVFADIDTKTYCISPKDIERKITPRTKAIIPVHIFGHPADMETICDIASKYGLKVICDAAQAHGARINGKPIASFGDASCYSFFQTKNMTTGEGGMVCTNDSNLVKRLHLKREHGSPQNPKTWYVYDELGYNYAMTEMQAAIGIEQLKKLEGFNTVRRNNAKAYYDSLADSGLTLPDIAKEAHHVFHNFPLLLPKSIAIKRDEFVKAIRAEGVPVDVCYPIPLYKTDLFVRESITGNCQNAEDFSRRVVTIFTDPVLTKNDVQDIAAAVSKVSRYYIGGKK
jgi:dTDP-4-amino-4,6-dideoxygalactose transaminase